MEILIYLPTDDQSITTKYMYSFLQRSIDSILLKLKGNRKVFDKYLVRGSSSS